MAVICDYCGKPAVQVTGEVIYPHRPDLAQRLFWLCKRCKAWVGCHTQTGKPFGRLAQVRLRRLKMDTHDALDPLWKTFGWTREETYAWLSRQLGIPRSKCHVGQFDEQQCEAAIRAVQFYLTRPRAIEQRPSPPSLPARSTECHEEDSRIAVPNRKILGPQRASDCGSHQCEDVCEQEDCGSPMETFNRPEGQI